MKGKGYFGYENKLMLLLSFILGFVFFDRMALSFLVPFFEKELQLNNTKIGLLNSMLALAWAVSGYIAGYWSDRTAKRKKYLLIAVVIFSACSFLSGLATNFFWLLIFRMIMGAAEGPVIPISQSLVLSNSPEKRRGLNMGFVQGFVTNILITLAPLLMVGIALKYGWRNGLFMAGVPGLVLAVIGFFLIKETPPAEAPELKRQSNARIILGYRNVRLCILLGSFLMIWVAIHGIFLPKYLVVVKHFTPGDMGLIMTCLGLGGIFWGLLLPFLSDRFGRKMVVLSAAWVSILMPLGIVLSGSTVGYVSLIVFAGGCILGALPIVLTIIPSESIPEAFVAQTIGLVVGIAEIAGGFIAPAVAGFTADTYGLHAAFYIAAGAALISGIACFLISETAPMLSRQKP